MNTEPCRIEVSGITVDIRRKPIKNLHVGVYPPNGQVRVAAPTRFDEEAIRLAVVSRLGWIRRQQKRFAEQPRESAREMVTGESHYFRGQRHRLNVVVRTGRAGVRIRGRRGLELQVPPGADITSRRRILEHWYRARLREDIAPLIQSWAPVMDVTVADWRIRRMKTRWGSCNTAARRIWLNLDLARKPTSCLEYIVVHEMVHLLERHHTDRFRQLMDHFLPDWRLRRDTLNQAPLAHAEWDY